MANKTIEELKSEAAVIRDATEEGENTATRVGNALIDMIDSLSNATVNGIKGYMVIDSTSELPTNPTSDQQMIGYLLDTTLYVYVGTGGDTLDGKYQSADLKGPQGATGPAGADGHDGVSLGEVALVNNLTEGGEESALTAEQGKKLKEIIDDGIFGYADFKEIPVAVTFVNKYYCNRQTGQKTSVNNTATNFSEAEINGADFVAFNGISVAMGGSSSYGYCFGYYATPNDASSWVTVNIGNWDVEGNENKLKRYFIKVPEGATHFRTTSSCYSLLTADNFFLSLIYGKNLEDELWGLYGYGDWVDYAQIDVTEKKRVNTNGSLSSNNNYDVWSVDVEGEDFVRFSRMQTADTPTFGYSFYDSSNVAIMPTQYVGNGVAQRLGDDILKVPENAKYFKFSVRRESTIGSFYVKKFIPKETTISDRLNDVEAKMETMKTGNPNEIEMPLVGLTLSNNKVVTDSIYTPEQFNFGGFKAVLPDNIGITWYRGDNPDNFGAGDSIEVYNGDIVKFPKKYSYYNIFRLHFHLIGEGTISVDMIKEHIANGEIKILYTPNDNHTSITQRQSHCEQYLRALQGRLVTNFGDTTRKCYGTHDLPMFVHCSDIHNDIVRLSSAIEYGKYIQADAVVLTGDYPMRGATNGIGYVKDLDEKWNPTTEDATQIMPILVGTGNHDPWHVTLEAMRADIIEPFVEKYNYREDSENLISGRAYYYVDLNVPAPRDGGYVNGSSTYNHTQLVRIIMLDLVDEQAGEISRWGISQTQIDWFIDTLNSTPSGAAILIGMHTSPDFMEAPSVRAAKYQQESPQVRELKYVTDMFTYKGFLANDSEFLNGSYNFSGSPIMGIIDAFISRTTASGSYTYKVGGTNYSIPQASVVTKTVNWAADFSNAGGVFVAYLCGHTHADLVSYIKDAQNTQLCLCTTCTVCEYGPYNNGRGSSNADCVRGSSGATQDGFNVYVLDMANKRVGIARIGANMTVGLEPRTACWLSFADTSV